MVQAIKDTFDASGIDPTQSGEPHPVGRFPATITNTSLHPVKGNNDAGMFRIEYTTPAGKINDNFNLWNPSEQAMDIAQKQLASVCHATGRFTLTGMQTQTPAPELRGATLMIEVANQLDKQTKQPNGYVEVKKVFDAKGNEPGKQASAPQPMQQVQPPAFQQPGPTAPPTQGFATQQPQVQSGWPNPNNPNQGPTGGPGWNTPPSIVGQGPSAEKPPWSR